MSPMSEPCPTAPPSEFRAEVRRFAASWLDWLGSRKTKTLLATIALTILAPHIGIPAAAVQWLIGLGAAGVAAQGAADFKTGGSR